MRNSSSQRNMRKKRNYAELNEGRDKPYETDYPVSKKFKDNDGKPTQRSTTNVNTRKSQKGGMMESSIVKGGKSGYVTDYQPKKNKSTRGRSQGRAKRKNSLSSLEEESNSLANSQNDDSNS